jgi:polycystin 1L2
MFRDQIPFCIDDYSVLNQEKNNFNYSWSPLFNQSYVPLGPTAEIFKAFQYTSSDDLDSTPYSGVYTSYRGGGYVFRILKTFTLEELQNNLTALQQMNWIDRQTRAVFIEFSLYNPNINLFAYCTIMFEILPTGNMMSSSRYEPINLLDIKSEFLSFKTICNFLYMFFIVFFMFCEIRGIMKMKKEYFKQFWNYIELIIIAFSWAAFSMFLYRLYASYEIFDLLKKRSTDPNTYIRLQYISYCNESLQVCLAFCAAFGTFRFAKLLRFNKKIIIYMVSFKNSLPELLSFGLIFFIIWFSFVQSFYVIFNQYLTLFSTMAKSMVTCFEMFLGKFAIDSLINANGFFATVLFFAYNIMICFILINTFLTILIDNFNEVKANSSHMDEEDPNLFEYLKFQFYSLVPEKFNQKYNKNQIQRFEYVDPVTNFPNKMNKLILKVQKV